MDFCLDDFSEMKNSEKVLVTCAGCDSDFSLKLGELRRRFGKKKHVNLYCSTECRQGRVEIFMMDFRTYDSYGRTLQPLWFDDDYQNRYYNIEE